MDLRIDNEIEIDAPAEQVWRVLGGDFGNIGRWASLIEHSRALTGDAKGGAGDVVGRVCTAKGFGEVEEVLTRYDDEARCLTYYASKGLPFFISQAENNWCVTSLGAQRCRLSAQANVVMKVFPGVLLAPVFRVVMKRKGAQMFEELKFYVEQGRPHSRKIRQLRRG